jgi:hypothetical protein
MPVSTRHYSLLHLCSLKIGSRLRKHTCGQAQRNTSKLCHSGGTHPWSSTSAQKTCLALSLAGWLGWEIHKYPVTCLVYPHYTLPWCLKSWAKIAIGGDSPHETCKAPSTPVSKDHCIHRSRRSMHDSCKISRSSASLGRSLLCISPTAPLVF